MISIADNRYQHEISASLDIQRKLYEDFSGKIHDYVDDLEGELSLCTL
jgi:hypothetical protein